MTVTPRSKKVDANGEKLSRVANAIDRAVTGTSLTQREIAKAVGFKNENMIAQIKVGRAKLPLDRVGAMAKVLELDPGHLFRMALEQFYEPEQLRMIMDIVDQGLPKHERAILDYIREKSKGHPIALTDEIKKAIDNAVA